MHGETMKKGVNYIYMKVMCTLNHLLSGSTVFKPRYSRLLEMKVCCTRRITLKKKIVPWDI